MPVIVCDQYPSLIVFIWIILADFPPILPSPGYVKFPSPFFNQLAGAVVPFSNPGFNTRFSCGVGVGVGVGSGVEVGVDVGVGLGVDDVPKYSDKVTTSNCPASSLLFKKSLILLKSDVL